MCIRAIIKHIRMEMTAPDRQDMAAYTELETKRAKLTADDTKSAGAMARVQVRFSKDARLVLTEEVLNADGSYALYTFKIEPDHVCLDLVSKLRNTFPPLRDRSKWIIMLGHPEESCSVTPEGLLAYKDPIPARVQSSDVPIVVYVYRRHEAYTPSSPAYVKEPGEPKEEAREDPGEQTHKPKKESKHRKPVENVAQ